MSALINIGAIFLWNISHIAAVNIIDCSQPDLCTSSTVSCDPSDDCTIICNQPNICNHKTLICPTQGNKQCHIQCIGSSCLYTTFDASNSIGSHLKISLNSNDNQGENVWSYGTLLCPPNGDCCIISTNDNIQHNTITALNSNLLNITIFGTNYDSNILYQSDIYCPINNAIYCDINIYFGILSSAKIYSVNPQFLWILCKTLRNCYDNQQTSTLYCGDNYSSQCNILSEHTLTRCICDNDSVIISNDSNHYQYINTTHTSADVVNVIYSQSNQKFWQTKTNLYYIIAMLSAIIVLALFVLCCFGICFKIKLSEIESKNQTTAFDSKKQKYDSNKYKLSLKNLNLKNNDNDLQVTSLVSPDSTRSNSVQFTVNNLFSQYRQKGSVSVLETTPHSLGGGKQQLHLLQPPIPPIPAPGMHKYNIQSKTVSRFGYGYQGRNVVIMQSPHSVIDVKRSAPISIGKVAPFGSHMHVNHVNHIIQSDSEANLISLVAGIRGSGLTNVPEIPLDGNYHNETIVENKVKNLQTVSSRHNCAMPSRLGFHHLLTDGNNNNETDSISMTMSVSTPIDEYEYDDGEVCHDTHNTSLKTMIIKQPNELTYGELSQDDHKRKQSDNIHIYDNQTTENSFTENSNEIETTTGSDSDEEEEEGWNKQNMISVLYDIQNNL